MSGRRLQGPDPLSYRSGDLHGVRASAERPVPRRRSAESAKEAHTLDPSLCIKCGDLPGRM